MKKIIVLVVLLVVSILTISAKDSTNVFKIGVGVSYTRWETPYHPNQNSLSHSYHTNGTFKYTDYVAYSPSVKIIYENQASKYVGFYFSLNYSYSKLGYDSSYTTFSFNPVQYGRASSETQTRHYKITPNNFMFGVGPKISLFHFYVVPKLDFSYYVAKINIDVNSTTITTDSTYSETSTTFKSEKENFSDAGIGVGLIVGYDFKIKHISFFIECEANYISTTLYQLKGANAGIVFGVRF